jgi:hypothetical protein
MDMDLLIFSNKGAKVNFFGAVPGIFCEKAD